MPSAQVIDLNPNPRTELTPLEKTLGGFSKRMRENQVEQDETDALKEIYSQYQADGKNLEKTIQEIQTKPGISPTTRVSTIKQLMEFQTHNKALQKQAQKEVSDKAKVADLERRRNLAPGSLAAYDDDPKMAEQVSREEKGTQASKPIDADQLKRIEHTLAAPDFNDKSPSEQTLALIRNGVSKENAKAVIDPRIEEAKMDNERGSVLRKEQAKMDVGFAQDQIDKIPQLAAKQRVFEEADALNEEGVTGQLWDQMMNKAGLLQYTSDGFRVFTSVAKDVIKNTNIKAVVGSQMSQQEFKFFTDATINPNFSKEANRQIIKKDQLALRYEKLYADITESLITQNNGEIPERLQQKVNQEFAKQSKKLNKQVEEARIDYEAIQNVPPGSVLMYDKKRRPIHVPANQVEKATKMGASLS